MTDANTEHAAQHLDTRAVTAGRPTDSTALAPVLWSTSAFATPTVEDARKRASGVRVPHLYSRYANPSVGGFEAAIAELEGAEAALAFASGMGAVATTVLALCSSGDHVVAQHQLYSGTLMFLKGVCPRFGIDVTFVDGTQPGAMAAAVRKGKTTLVFAETPANPRLDVVDLDELGAIRGPFTVVDSTFATPALQQPLRHGVSLVLHSATKGIGGHNDATLGVVAGERDLLDAIWSYSVLHGAVASPFDALNALRGIRTLPIRVARQSQTAEQLATFLEGHPAVERVWYPGLDSHPQRDVAKRQMASGGTLLAVEVKGGMEGGVRFVEGVRLARMAPSLGGPDTLVVHPASSTHVALTPDELAASGITPGMIRVSVGLEHPDDVQADFAQALAR